MFNGISTERLKKWLENVRYVLDEYENGLHAGSVGCQHCHEEQIYRHANKFSIRCMHCIWMTIDKRTCTSYSRANNNITFCSDEISDEELDIHITRCNDWIDLIQKELDRRKK